MTLLNRLIGDGLDVSVAFWMYSNEDERWGLYVASESMNSWGIKKSYTTVVLALKSKPALRIDLSEVTLLEPERPLAAAVLDVIHFLPAGHDVWIEAATVR